MLRVELAGDSSKIALEDLSSSTFAGASYSESVSNASMPSLITNSDQGALASYAISSSSLSEVNGVQTSSYSNVAFHLATTSGASMTSKVQMAGVPGQQHAAQPVLQHQDGNFIGTVSTSAGSSMIAFTPSGNTLFTVPNDTAQIATAGGGVIGTSGTTYDQNGNANGHLSQLPTYSWTHNAYQLDSIESFNALLIDQGITKC